MLVWGSYLGLLGAISGSVLRSDPRPCSGDHKYCLESHRGYLCCKASKCFNPCISPVPHKRIYNLANFSQAWVSPSGEWGDYPPFLAIKKISTGSCGGGKVRCKLQSNKTNLSPVRLSPCSETSFCGPPGLWKESWDSGLTISQQPKWPLEGLSPHQPPLQHTSPSLREGHFPTSSLYCLCCDSSGDLIC